MVVVLLIAPDGKVALVWPTISLNPPIAVNELCHCIVPVYPLKVSAVGIAL